MCVLDNGIFYSMDTSLQHRHQFTAWTPVYSRRLCSSGWNRKRVLVNFCLGMFHVKVTVERRSNGNILNFLRKHAYCIMTIAQTSNLPQNI